MGPLKLGATLEAIAWYREKKKDMKDIWRMNSEYPALQQKPFNLPADDVSGFQTRSNYAKLASILFFMVKFQVRKKRV